MWAQEEQGQNGKQKQKQTGMIVLGVNLGFFLVNALGEVKYAWAWSNLHEELLRSIIKRLKCDGQTRINMNNVFEHIIHCILSFDCLPTHHGVWCGYDHENVHVYSTSVLRVKQCQQYWTDTVHVCFIFFILFPNEF